MKKSSLILIFACVCNYMQAQVNIITTICGTDTAGYNSDGIPANNAELYAPNRICIDKSGNIYIADAFNQRIRKIDVSTGFITTIAGTGSADFFGDGVTATDARLYVPEGVFSDTAGNIYIADAGNNRIRKITIATGIVTTVAGSGPSGGYLTGGYIGDNGAATNAELNNPSGLCLDKLGNIYIADNGNNRIRKVDVVTGIITTIAGQEVVDYSGGFVGYSGDGGPATDAVFSGVIQVFADGQNNIFVCDQWNHAVRRIDAITGIITTIAGKGTSGYSGDNGPATNAQLDQPNGGFVDEHGNIFLAEYGNGVIRKVDGTTGIITTVAGTGTRGFFGDGGPATNAELKCTDLVLDKYGTIYIADQDNSRIRMVRDTTLRIAVSIITKTEIKVYPNPAYDELNITEVMGNINYRILNTTGVNVDQGELHQGDNTIPVLHLAPGIYTLELTGVDGQRNIVRVVKE